MEHIIKKHIARTFTRYSDTYDQYAKLQKLSAGFIFENIEEIISSMPVGPVLEIGCGSGLVSEEIVKRLPQRDLVLMDISAGMLTTCRKRLNDASLNHAGIQYVENDAEKLNEQNKYALIVSGLTLQWFHNISAGVEKIVNALLPGGIFVCSFLGEGSFLEWQEQCENSKVPCTLNPLPDFNFITKRFKEEVKDISFAQNSLTLSYPSVHDFFVSLKKTGTGVNVSGQKNSLAEMRRLIREWEQTSPNGVDVTCKINCLTITR